MKTLFKKIGFLVGGAAALIGFGTQPVQAAPADSVAKLEGISEKSQLVLTHTAYSAGKDMGIQAHYSHSSHSSHSSHQSHHSHYSGR